MDFNNDRSIKIQLTDINIYTDRPFVMGVFEILVIKKEDTVNLRFFPLDSLTNDEIKRIAKVLNEKIKSCS
jgi:hypothetical protein